MATPQRIRQQMPVGGLRSSWPADALEPTQSPRAINVRFRFGEVRSGPGRDVLSGPNTAEDVLWIGRYPMVDGTEWALKLSETGFFRWGSAVPGTPREWHTITGPGMTGTNRWSTCIGENRFFFAKKSNAIHQWSGAVADPFGALGGAAPTNARFVAYFANHLVAGDTVEGGSEYTNRIRWAKNGDYTTWTGDGTGFLDLGGVGDEGAVQAPLMGLHPLGQRLAAYTAFGILDVIATGTLTPVFRTEQRIWGLGCKAPYTIASTGQEHLFLGTDRNVYIWDGTKLTPIGDPILEELRGLVSSDSMETCFATVATERQEYWLILRDGNVFVFDYKRGVWARDTFPDITALGEVVDTRAASLWSTWTNTWEQETRTWDELGGASRSVLWGGRSDGATFTVDEQVAWDYFAVGSIMERYVETPDFYLPDPNGSPDPRLNVTLQRMLLSYEYVDPIRPATYGGSEANPPPFLAEVSMDRGQTWQSQAITPQRGGYSLLDWNLTGHVIRFRFRESDVTGQFRWRSYQWEFVDAGPWNG